MIGFDGSARRRAAVWLCASVLAACTGGEPAGEAERAALARTTGSDSPFPDEPGPGSAFPDADPGPGSDGPGPGSGSDPGPGSDLPPPSPTPGPGSDLPLPPEPAPGPGSDIPPPPGPGSDVPPPPPPPPPSCNLHRRPLDWRAAPGELDGRDWTDEQLAPSSNPDIYLWSHVSYGAISDVRIAPPHYYDTPAYAFGIDYDGTIDECPTQSVVQLWFQPGIYTVELSFRDGRPRELYTLFAGAVIDEPISGVPSSPSPFAPDKNNKEKDPNCQGFPEYDQIPWNMIPYDPGAFIIEEPPDDDAAMANAVKVMGDKAVRAKDIDAGATRITDAYTTKGSSLNVVIEAHGNATSQSIGAGTKWDDAKMLFMRGSKTNKAFLDKVSAGPTQRVHRIALLGCCVASRLDELKGDHLMCDMARGLAPGDTTTEVLGFKYKTSSVLPTWYRSGYFTVSGSKWANAGRLIKKGHCDGWDAQPK